MVRSPFELAMIDRTGAVIATEGQGGIPGAPVNTIYQLPPGGEYGLDILGVPEGQTVASVELTILGEWFEWATVNPPTVTVTDTTVLSDDGVFGPSVTGRLTLDQDGPLNVVVVAFVTTSTGTVVSDVIVDCVQTGQRRTFQTNSIADARGPYTLDGVVAYATAVEGAGPNFDPRCSSPPAGAPPPAASGAGTLPPSSPSPRPTSVPPSPASPPPLRMPSLSDAHGDRPDGDSGHLVAVRLARNDGFDRLVFEFADGVPSYTIGYRPLPAYADPSGADIPLPGANAAVRVVLSGATGNGGGVDGERTYFGASTVTADTAVVTEAKAAGDFESVLSWVVGLRSEVPFSVLVFNGPPRLVIDFVR
ncbi:hypothetical protein AU196_01360 [Mycobacterium sp. IS-1742]|nr:hypothetical protein AU196_01360 [Mycobacterium sp. IS-1742]